MLHVSFEVRSAERDLEWYWCDREAALGLGSTFGIMADRLAGLSRRADARFLPFEEGPERPESLRARRIYRGLRGLEGADLQILYAAFGPRAPAARSDVLDERTARLAPYTAWVEERRLTLARDLAVQRYEVACHRFGNALDDAQRERVRASHLRSALLEVTPSDALLALLGPRIDRWAPVWDRALRRSALADSLARLDTEVATLLERALGAYRAQAVAE
ncbi:MAG TPA: hypothetical protein VGI39_12790 [Polyangiaceae bacterium]